MSKLHPGKYWQAKVFLLYVFALIQSIRLGLWARSWQQVTHLLSKLSASLSPTPWLKSLTIHQIVNGVQVVSHYSPGQVKCLARAIATTFLMDGAGYSNDLKIGVAKSEAGAIEAHAWVEYQGMVVMGQVERLSEFIPLQ